MGSRGEGLKTLPMMAMFLTLLLVFRIDSDLELSNGIWWQDMGKIVQRRPKMTSRSILGTDILGILSSNVVVSFSIDFANN